MRADPPKTHQSQKAEGHNTAFADSDNSYPSRTATQQYLKAPTTCGLIHFPLHIFATACRIRHSSHSDTIKLQIIRYHHSAVTTAPHMLCIPLAADITPTLGVSVLGLFRLDGDEFWVVVCLLPHYCYLSASEGDNHGSRNMALALLHALH